MQSLCNPRQNKILGRLPVDEFTRLLPFLDFVDMPHGQVIHEPGATLGEIYFPATSIVARIYELKSGLAKHVSMTGNEGISDIFFLSGGERSSATVIVQNPGYGYRIKAKILKKEFEAGGSLKDLLLGFSHALLLQTEQTAVEASQSVEQRLCLFFLMILDRLSDGSMAMTHEFLGYMLGVRRESVSGAAHVLQLEGAIRYRRGHITLVNRKAMEDRVNEGYAMLKKEYERLLPHALCYEPGSVDLLPS
ncbi:Crp/Fnr family transcriptional regulator [Nitrosospira sp. Is2]|uniref:Crp/Fnr family transcriptional regulator n=1 Tax=Nitrosospira sp. Is2 TaxID=3080532 RepID=UPI0029547055|nr:Crp/Fnr family transcriptional regulator [Nitrosospira sp. Is2]WON74192.1 Crp/Fnr family transcriptional regulator [Nitrosospira sp. Is2]